MVTDKAREIATQLRAVAADDLNMQRELSDALFAELMQYCQPTLKEFEELATGAILSAATLYRILTGKYLNRWAFLYDE